VARRTVTYKYAGIDTHFGDPAAACGASIGRCFYGTSAAAPHAAALAALVKSAKLSLTASQVKAALINGAIDVQPAGWDRDSGVGIIMADTAVAGVIPPPFTDDPLVAGSTVAKAVHITELRTRIDAVRMSKGLGGYSWVDPTLTARASILRAVHISDLRTALSQAYVAAGMSAPVFTTDPGLALPSHER